jgi:hypothetical protein
MLSGIDETELSADIAEQAPRYPGRMPSKDKDGVWQRNLSRSCSQFLRLN